MCHFLGIDVKTGDLTPIINIANHVGYFIMVNGVNFGNCLYMITRKEVDSLEIKRVNFNLINERDKKFVKLIKYNIGEMNYNERICRLPTIRKRTGRDVRNA